MKYQGMVRDGPKKGKRQACNTPKFECVVLPDPPIAVGRYDATDPDEAVYYDKYTYVWHEGGDGKLAGWWLM